MPLQKANQKVNVATGASTKKTKTNFNNIKHIQSTEWIKYFIPIILTAIMAGVFSLYERVVILEKGTFHYEIVDHRLNQLEECCRNKQLEENVYKYKYDNLKILKELEKRENK